MSDLDDELGEIVSRHSIKKIGTVLTRTEFHRRSYEHFAAYILPEMRRFEESLKHQGVLVTINPLHQFNKDVLQSLLIIESPANVESKLSFCYDFKRNYLEVSQIVRDNTDELPVDGLDYHIFGCTEEINQTRLNEILKYFVSSVFD